MPVIIDGTLGVNAAAITTTNWTPTNITTGGNTTLGDASADTVTVNAGTLTTPNNLSVNSNLLYVDNTNSRIGIGTNSAAAKLHINANSTSLLPPIATPSSSLVISAADGANASIFNVGYGAAGGQFYGYSIAGTAAAPASTGADYSLLMLKGGGYAGSAVTGSRAFISMNAAENWTSTANGTYIYFYTTPIGSTAGAERMRIDSVGNIFTGGVGGSVGQADANSTAGQQVVLGTKRELRWNNTNAAIYGGAGGSDDMLYFYSGNSHVFRTASAERLRIDINGNVGIGTNAPTTPLEINWSGSAALTLTYQNSTSRRAFLGGNPGYSASYNALIIGSNATAVGTQSNTALPSWYTAYGAYTLDGDGWKVLYQPAGGSVVERLRIDGSGYAMINTQTASGQFTVYRKGGDNVVAITGDNSNSAGTGTCFSAISKSDNAGGGKTGTGLYVSSPYDGTNASGTTYSLNKYGVYIDDIYSYYGVNTTNSFTNYGIYAKGGGYNYFAANTGIGTNQPAAKLDVNGRIKTTNAVQTEYNAIAHATVFAGGKAGYISVPTGSTWTRLDVGSTHSGVPGFTNWYSNNSYSSVDGNYVRLVIGIQGNSGYVTGQIELMHEYYSIGISSSTAANISMRTTSIDGASDRGFQMLVTQPFQFKGDTEYLYIRHNLSGSILIYSIAVEMVRI